MFPGNRNKKILIEKIVDVKIDEQQENIEVSYLADKIKKENDSESKKSASFILTKIQETSSQDKRQELESEKKEDELLDKAVPFKKETDFMYNIDKVIRKDFRSIELQDKQQIMLCAYNVNTENIKPFLTYLLYNNTDTTEDSDNLFYFPFINYNSSIELVKQVEDQFLFLTKFDISLNVKGFLINNKIPFIFIETSSLTNENKRDSKYVWCMIDEIINQKKIYNVDIHKSVSSLFYRNPDLLYLYNKENTPIEVPTILYTSDNYNISSFNSVFGKRKEETFITSLGELYMFYTFNTAKQQVRSLRLEEITEKSTDARYAIVRYAVFLGKMKVLTKDELEKMHLQEKENKWYLKYDSAYVGKITLQNGDIVKDTPIYFINNYDQQIPLSLLEIDN